MTAYNKRYGVPGTQPKQHGHELSCYEKELLQRVKEKKDKRQQLLAEIRRRRARNKKYKVA